MLGDDGDFPKTLATVPRAGRAGHSLVRALRVRVRGTVGIRVQVEPDAMLSFVAGR